MGIGTDFDDEHPKVHSDGTVEAAWGWEHAAHTDSWHVATDAGERLTVAEYEAVVAAAAGTMVGFLAALRGELVALRSDLARLARIPGPDDRDPDDTDG